MVSQFYHLLTASLSLILHRLNENPSIGHKVAYHSGSISDSEPSGESSDESLHEPQCSNSVGSSSRSLTPSQSSASRSSTPSLFYTPGSRTSSPHPSSYQLSQESNLLEPSTHLQGPSRPLGSRRKPEYTPGVPVPIHKKVRALHPPSSSSVDSAAIQDLVANSSQMISLMLKTNTEQLNLAKEREKRAAEQHQSQLLAQQSSVYQQIITNNDLPDDVRKEAQQALIKLLHGN